MGCPCDHDMLLLYAADALDEGEKTRLQTHLVNCEACQAALAEARDVWAAVGLAETPARSTSTFTKARLMTAAATSGHLDGTPTRANLLPRRNPGAEDAARQPRFTKRKPAIWEQIGVGILASILGALGTFVYVDQKLTRVQQLRSTLAELQAAPQPQSTEAAQRLLSWIDSPAVEVIFLESPSRGSQAWGRLFWNARASQAYFIGTHLSSRKASEPYRLWLITKTGKRINAGTFKLNQRRLAHFKIDVPKRVKAVSPRPAKPLA